MRKGKRATILVCGMIAADPGHGGATWAVLQYVLGLQRLGHEVYLLEPLNREALRPELVGIVDREACVSKRPACESTSLAASANATYFQRVAESYGLVGHSTLLVSGTEETVGLDYPELLRVAARADLVLNISGMLTDPAILQTIPIRVYLDLDPAFNQLWSAVQGIDMRFEGHSHFVTVGLNLGTSECDVPTAGRDWIRTLPPVVLEHWPEMDSSTGRDFTTVANWRGYGSIEHGGVKYGQKAHSLREFIDLPRRSAEVFRLALGIHPGESRDLALLEDRGWIIQNPMRETETPARYREFIQGSRAEIGIAKSGYVLSRCGWFSDRSACYLASGRPVLAQETGFSRHLPTGEGLIAFSTLDEAIAGVDSIGSRYCQHSQAAREIAARYLHSDLVLGRLLMEVGL